MYFIKENYVCTGGVTCKIFCEADREKVAWRGVMEINSRGEFKVQSDIKKGNWLRTLVEK